MTWCPFTDSSRHTSDCYTTEITCGNREHSENNSHTEDCKEQIGPTCGGTR